MCRPYSALIEATAYMDEDGGPTYDSKKASLLKTFLEEYTIYAEENKLIESIMRWLQEKSYDDIA